MKQRARGFGSLAITIQRTSQQRTSDSFKSIGERIRPILQFSSAGNDRKVAESEWALVRVCRSDSWSAAARVSGTGASEWGWAILFLKYR